MGLELRKLIPVRLDERLLILRDILLQRNRLILRRSLEPLERRLDLLDRRCNPLAISGRSTAGSLICSTSR